MTTLLVSAMLVSTIPLAAVSQEFDLYFVHSDHLGTPRKLTDEGGTVVWAANYQPFGDVSHQVTQVTNNMRFPGQYLDVETGLHYNYFRDYDPKIGRYIVPDPAGLNAEINLYTYVENSPGNFIDPAGLAKKNPNVSFRDCEADEYEECRNRCGRMGVLRCRIQVVKKTRRVINRGDGKTLERLHFDENLLCECGDDEPAAGCGTGCKVAILTAIGILCLTPIPGDEAVAIGAAGSLGILSTQ